MKVKYISIYLSLLVIFFSSTLSIINQYLKYLMVIIPFFIVYIYMLKILVKNKQSLVKSYALSFYLLYGIISVFVYYIINIKYYQYSPIFGFINLYFFYIFWYFIFLFSNNCLKFFNTIINYLIVIGIIMAIGAYIQFFISPNIFGLIYNKIYSNNLELSSHITKRAISFIQSPQSLGLFLAIVSILILISQNRFKYILFVFVMVAGLLTFSKVFVVVLVSFIILKQLKNFSLFRLIVMFIISGMIIIIFQDYFIDKFSRILEIIYLIQNISKYDTFNIWMNFLFYPSTIFQILFGHGLGIMGRASQMIGDYSILNGSTESFILQIYFEIGLVGLILFLLLFFLSIYNFYSIKEKKIQEYYFLMISIIPCMLGTPAFYSITSGFILSFFIIASIFIKKQKLI